MLLAIGMGSFAVFESRDAGVETSATIQDLEWYNCNAQIIQQLSSFDTDDQGTSPVR
jgi:hypothetical protein